MQTQFWGPSHFSDSSDFSSSTPKIWNPDNDGIDHINVYSKGRTELGRALSNFARTPFTCQDGHFESIEGYWYWLGTSHPDRDKLRECWGSDAKYLGKLLRVFYEVDVPDFNARICDALDAKLWGHREIRDGLQESSQQLVHYYILSGGVVVEPTKHRWVIEYLESYR